jgi:hypothetical protein
MRDVTTAATRGYTNHADGVGSQQVDHPPGRRLLHRFRASFAIMHCRALPVVAIASGSATHCRRLVCWLPESYVCSCKQIYGVYCSLNVNWRVCCSVNVNWFAGFRKAMFFFLQQIYGVYCSLNADWFAGFQKNCCSWKQIYSVYCSLNIEVKWLTDLVHNRRVPGSKLGPEICCPGTFSWPFSGPLDKCWCSILIYAVTLPSTLFPIHNFFFG